MKPLLLFRNDDVKQNDKYANNEMWLRQDLELNVLFNAMAYGDEFILEIVKKTMSYSLFNDIDTILYRQDILKDSIKNPQIIRKIYSYAVHAIENEKGHWYGVTSRHPSMLLNDSIERLEAFDDVLKQLKVIADEHSKEFQSKGFTRFFSMIKNELDDKYFSEVKVHLNELKFQDGVFISADLGVCNKGIHYTLRKQKGKKIGWMQKIFLKDTNSYHFDIYPGDENGVAALSELRDEGIQRVANATFQAANHILNFFITLRSEMALYIGCLNLHEQLTRIGGPTTFPVPTNSGERNHTFTELYDVCLALTANRKIVGNNLSADNKTIFIITGANQGGKSTFLRSIGLAQLMMQCGMFVPAEFYRANICDSLFTHYRREEDIGMKSGKLDEELSRMSDIADHVTPNSILLFNESFAATNEREGSEISRQIVSALLEKRIKVFFVTHLYTFAHGFYDSKKESTVFLQAEREADGLRTFKLVEGEPSQTSYGIDLYDKVFSDHYQA